VVEKKIAQERLQATMLATLPLPPSLQLLLFHYFYNVLETLAPNMKSLA